MIWRGLCEFWAAGGEIFGEIRAIDPEQFLMDTDKIALPSAADAIPPLSVVSKTSLDGDLGAAKGILAYCIHGNIGRPAMRSDRSATESDPTR
jgi:hypothetical protein